MIKRTFNTQVQDKTNINTQVHIKRTFNTQVQDKTNI